MTRCRTDEQLLDALRSIGQRFNGALGVVDYQRLRGPGPATSTIGTRFGGWAVALDLAGLEPTGRRRIRKWTSRRRARRRGLLGSDEADRRHAA